MVRQVPLTLTEPGAHTVSLAICDVDGSHEHECAPVARSLQLSGACGAHSEPAAGDNGAWECVCTSGYGVETAWLEANPLRRSDFSDGCVRCSELTLPMFGSAHSPRPGREPCMRSHVTSVVICTALVVLLALLVTGAVAARNATLFARQWNFSGTGAARQVRQVWSTW